MREPFLVLLAVLSVAQNGSAACGIHFQVPGGWVTHVTHPDDNQCQVGVSPRNWKKLAAKSRWPEGDDAITVNVVDGDLDDAADVAGFARGDDGRLWTNDRGRFFPVSDVTYGGMSGYEAEGWYRGFAKDDVDLRGSSRLYSGTFHAILLKRADESYIVIRYHEWSPDTEQVDRVKAAKVILRTIRGR